MHHLYFRTADPYDAVPRMLDYARKSGFLPQDLRLRPDVAGDFCLDVVFGPTTGLSFETLTDQLRRIITVCDLITDQSCFEQGGATVL